MESVPASYWTKGVDYDEYCRLMALELGPEEARVLRYPAQLHRYMDLNVRRMERWERRQVEINALTLQASERIGFRILAITEGWCGDSAHIIPFLEKLVAVHPDLQVRYLFRDAVPELMDAFLTEGSRSIPKFILTDATGRVLGSWGPRPEELQSWYMEEKRSAKMDPHDLSAELQRRYNSDKGVSILKELTAWLQASLRSKEGPGSGDGSNQSVSPE